MPGGGVAGLLGAIAAGHLLHVEAAFAGKLFPVTVDFGDDFVFRHGLDLQKFRRRADERALEAQALARGRDAAFEFQIVDVRAIPRQEILHPMHGGEGDVEGVRCRGRRDDAAHQAALGECIGFGCVGKEWNPREHVEPFAGEFGVALGRLSHHDRRDEQFIFVAAKVPPVLRRLLIGGNSRQRTASRDEVAGDGGFEVEA